MNTTMATEIRQHCNDTQYQLVVIFSDNPYRMVFDGKLEDCRNTEAIIIARAHDFFSKKTNILKTTDLNFKYIKRG